MSSPHNPTRSGGQIGRYRLVKRIAVGGMADLFLAQVWGARGYERTVVLKKIRSDLTDDPQQVQILLEEARIAACLRHPHIVELYEVGEHEDGPYLVMEFIFGCDLGKLRDRCFELGIHIPHAHLLTIFIDVLDALHHAHAEARYQAQPLRAIHRDISPQNIIVGFDGAPKLVDFGLAKAAMQISKTHTGMLKGKYAYMAPEQVNMLGVDARSDVFSVGIVLWELLTERRLFLRNTDVATLLAVKAGQVPWPRSKTEPIPLALAWACYRALRSHPRWRYPTALRMREALLRIDPRPRSQARHQLAEWLSLVFQDKFLQREILLNRTRAEPSRFREALDSGFELLDDVTEPAYSARANSLKPRPAATNEPAAGMSQTQPVMRMPRSSRNPPQPPPERHASRSATTLHAEAADSPMLFKWQQAFAQTPYFAIFVLLCLLFGLVFGFWLGLQYA